MRNTIVWVTGKLSEASSIGFITIVLLSLDNSEQQPSTSTAGALRIIDQTDNSTIESNITVLEKRLGTLSGCKWILSSGKCVEGALYELGMNCITEHLCHSFIVAHSDKTYAVSSVFTQQELTEIAETNSKPCPEPSKEFLDYLNTFNRRNTKDLRQSVFASQPWDTEYDKELHCD
ncbi:hypothetical protein RMATCC62417_07946 [Rhizopus microsporus]|nr:hypothetical protein RMATCC62417_07946 [Rhizopus microsporus]